MVLERGRFSGSPTGPDINGSESFTKARGYSANFQLRALVSDAIYPFGARGIAKRFPHAAGFAALDALRAGRPCGFCNDHDPLPLLDGSVAPVLPGPPRHSVSTARSSSSTLSSRGNEPIGISLQRLLGMYAAEIRRASLHRDVGGRFCALAYGR